MRKRLSSFFSRNTLEWQGATVSDIQNILNRGKEQAASSEEDKSQAPGEVCDGEGNTVVHLAAYFGCNPKTLKFLLTVFSDSVHKLNHDHRSPIMVAAIRGFPKLVHVLFVHDPETAQVQNSFGHRALEMAKIAKRVETVAILKDMMSKHGISIGVLDVFDRNDGWVDTTPNDIDAILASKYSDNFVRKGAGLGSNADKNSECRLLNVRDKFGKLPLYYAIVWEAPASTLRQLLVENILGLMDPTVWHKKIWSIVRVADINLLLEHDLKSLHKRVDDDGHTLLHKAIIFGAPRETIMYILDQNLFALLAGGEIGFHYINLSQTNRFILELKTRAQQSGLELNAENKAQNGSENQACSRYPKLLCRVLHLAVKYQSTENVVERIIDAYPQACESQEKDTLKLPLHVAMDNNNTSQVPILWATYPAAINATDIYGQTPIPTSVNANNSVESPVVDDQVCLARGLKKDIIQLCKLGLERNVVNTEAYWYYIKDGIPGNGTPDLIEDKSNLIDVSEWSYCISELDQMPIDYQEELLRKEEVEVQKLSTLAEELDPLTDRTALRTGRSTLDSSRFGSARSRQSSALNEQHANYNPHADYIFVRCQCGMRRI